MKCDHYWSYLQTIWQGRLKYPNEVTVGRWCSKCGKQQCAFASVWRPIPASFPDMKDALKDEPPQRVSR